jgi:hypothetical protein
VLDGLMLLMKKIETGDREPRVVPPRELPEVTRLRASRQGLPVGAEEKK